MRYLRSWMIFLSKKDLQETLKSKWADLLIHGDVTILTYEFVLSKYLFVIDCYFNKIAAFSCLIVSGLLKTSNFQDCLGADYRSLVSDPTAFVEGI
ncbi:hypothetical protein LV85_01969 [Algoriphagus chordae]|uniref:Uncharacterized protein n=1 Tax=Algoriphagus chordae TaxID=237019 RepID=A0A2W7RAI0_9BACT|nr:hypothetical protein LV85_01969 [Algoriphagus chordae]